MKKKSTMIIIGFILLAVICASIFLLFGMEKEKPGTDGEYSFAAKVIEVKDKHLLVEVTDSGNSALQSGTKVDVSTNVTSADGCPSVEAGDHVSVVFNGEVMEKNPPALGTVFHIYKTDASGKNILN